MKRVIIWQDNRDPMVYEGENIYKNFIIIMTTIHNGYKSWTLSKKSEMVVYSFEEEKLRRKWESVKESEGW
jgi:hypothetical protein